LRRVVIVTDGDCTALESVERACDNLGARCISITGCRNTKDTHWTPKEVEELVLSSPRDPVVVLVDDEGFQGEGGGERIIRHLVGSDRIKVVGVVAVASNLQEGVGATVHASITADGNIVDQPVNKDGDVDDSNGEIKGDTVEVLNELNIPLVVGLGDPGKMNMADDAKQGAPLTTKAIKWLLDRDREMANI